MLNGIVYLRLTYEVYFGSAGSCCPEWLTPASEESLTSVLSRV
jgi:hypothetical protein